jgi:hypothetical protein
MARPFNHPNIRLCVVWATVSVVKWVRNKWKKREGGRYEFEGRYGEERKGNERKGKEETENLPYVNCVLGNFNCQTLSHIYTTSTFTHLTCLQMSLNVTFNIFYNFLFYFLFTPLLVVRSFLFIFPIHIYYSSMYKILNGLGYLCFVVKQDKSFYCYIKCINVNQVSQSEWQYQLVGRKNTSPEPCSVSSRTWKCDLEPEVTIPRPARWNTIYWQDLTEQ